MKTNVFALVIFCALAPCVRAQEALVPEFSGRPYYVKENALAGFERVDGNLSASTSAKGMITFYNVGKDKSDTRFSASSMPRILIKVEAGVDPGDLIKVVKGEVTKKGRQFTVRKADRKNTALDISEVLLKVTFNKVGDGIYEFVFEGVAPGEYAVVSSTETNSGMALTAKLSCFGID